MTKYDPRKNAEGYNDPTPYAAEKHMMAQIRGKQARVAGGYLSRSLAKIEKTPEPMKPLGAKNRKGQFLACYTKQAQPDYGGTLNGGRSIYFEAKHTDDERIEQRRLTQEQQDDLEAHHKLGAIAIPATNQLLAHDFTYRFQAAGVSAIVCTADGDTAHQVDLALEETGLPVTKIIANGTREGWHSFDDEYKLFSRRYVREADAPCGKDPMLMFFTSGTTGYPKIAMHSYKYALGHFVTAKYWHWVQPDGLHFTISETGWGKALWGKLYGQWLCEGAVFTYDFDRFDASKILPMFAKYHITTFCAPPTMYRMLIKQDLSQYDLSSIQHATTAGEALNPEVFYQFRKATGLQIAEGYGQTEMTLGIGNLTGNLMKPGSMGKPIPGYGIDLVDPDGNPVADGVNGEICIKTSGDQLPCGLFLGYYQDEGRLARRLVPHRRPRLAR